MLPARRYERRMENDGQRTWCFDFDGTITAAPDRLARIARGLKALGDRVVVLTGNTGTRESLLEALAGFGVPFDELVQYDDTDAMGRASIERELGAWGGFDNRVDRAPVLVQVCPQLFVIAAPLDDAE